MDVKKHTGFWLRHLHLLPGPYAEEETARMTLGMFVVGAMDVLGVLNHKTPLAERQGLADWVYAQQVPTGGFRGSPSAGPAPTEIDDILGRGGNIVMTYSALNILSVLRDDFTRLNRKGIKALLRSCQQPDGSFVAFPGTTEADVRFVYAAFVVAYMLDAWDAVDVPLTLRFLHQCQTYDHGFSQAPGQESHGGSTYCAIASLILAGQLPLPNQEPALGNDEWHTPQVIRWLLEKQVYHSGDDDLEAQELDTDSNSGEESSDTGTSSRRNSNTTGTTTAPWTGSGFCGRRLKDPDVCYSFWCGAALVLLGAHHLIDASADVRWVLACQSSVGGIAKVPNHPPDVLHAYLGTVALSMHLTTATATTSSAPSSSADRLTPSEQSRTGEASTEASTALRPERRSRRSSTRTGRPGWIDMLPALAPITAQLNMTRASAAWAQGHLHSRTWQSHP